jgi:hypothetical protein
MTAEDVSRAAEYANPLDSSEQAEKWAWLRDDIPLVLA